MPEQENKETQELEQPKEPNKEPEQLQGEAQTQAEQQQEETPKDHELENQDNVRNYFSKIRAKENMSIKKGLDKRSLIQKKISAQAGPVNAKPDIDNASLAMYDHASADIEPSETEPEDRTLNSQMSRFTRITSLRQSETYSNCRIVALCDNLRSPDISEATEQSLTNQRATSSCTNPGLRALNKNKNFNMLINNANDANQNNSLPCDKHVAANVDISLNTIDAAHRPVAKPTGMALLDHNYNSAQINETGTKFKKLSELQFLNSRSITNSDKGRNGRSFTERML